MARQRISTGIEGLDNLIEGGLQENKSYLICGEPGTGKTILCLQFILHGLQNSESGVYVSIDEKPEHLIEDAAALGWDLQSHVDAGRLLILDVSPFFTGIRLGKEKQIDVRQIITDLSKHVKRMNAKRLVIDPVAALAFERDAVSAMQEYIRSLFFSIDDNLGCTTLMTSHIRPGSHELSHYGVEEFFASGIIWLKLIKPAQKYVRTLFVRKMRGTATDLSEYAFEILSNRGIVIRQPL